MPQPQLPTERPTLPLSLLMDESGFAARMLSPEGGTSATASETRFSLAIVVELQDPTPYLTRGDLLLITGLGLPTDPKRIDEYVIGVAETGVVGIVFGLEPVYPAVPDALITACRAHGLPLLELPSPVYFASIVAYVNRALESERTRSLSATVSAAQRLTEAVMHPRPMQRLLSVLAHECGGWAVLHGEDGTLSAGAVPPGLDLDPLLAGLADRIGPQLLHDGTPTAFSTATAAGVEYEITAHAVRRPRGQTHDTGSPPLLAFGKSPRITGTDRTVLMLAADLAGLVAQMPPEQSAAVDQLLMHFLADPAMITGSNRDRVRVMGLVSSALGADAVSGSGLAYAVVAERADGSQTAAGVAEAAWLRRLLHSPLVEQRGRRMRAFTAHPPNGVELEQASELGWILAVSQARELADLPAAMRQADELSRSARRLGRHISGHDPEDLSRIWPLAALTDPTLSAAAAELWLAPLDGEEHAEERSTLSAWLLRHGSWDRTARDLGLHRNTVRRLVAAAGERLGRDLDDPVERARLLLAFAATGAEA